MDQFFQAGVGFEPQLVQGIEQMMHQMMAGDQSSYGEYPTFPPLGDTLVKDRGDYDELDNEEEGVPKRIRQLVKEQKLQTTPNPHDFEKFDNNLQRGILDAPNLDLGLIPPIVFDNQCPITIVYLRNNNISEVPDYFFDELQHLEWLDLRDNNLTSIPPLNVRHEALRVLLLQGNRITALPYTLALAVNLRTIGITGNPITSPPEEVQKQGCQKMMDYLREKMVSRTPLANGWNVLSTPVEDDERLRADLKSTAMKCVRSNSRSSKLNKGSISTSISEPNSEKKRHVEKVVYTWDLWKRIPYDGVSKSELFEKSFADAKSQLMTKLNMQEAKILQNCKNKDFLRKWRSDTELLRQRESTPSIQVATTQSAPFGNDFNGQSPNPRKVRPTEYRKELGECFGKLEEFSKNPIPLSDTEQALNRLKEVEDVYKRIVDLKLTLD